MTPYFSILIPSFNRPGHLPKTLDSILANDFDDYEIIISDDNSPQSDEIARVLQPYLKNNKISFFQQKENLKEPGNKNFLVNRAKGKFNIILGDDDKLYPHTLRTIKEYVEKNPDFCLFVFGYTVIDENDIFYYTRQASERLVISMLNKNLIKQVFISDIFPFWLYHPSTFCCRKGVERDILYSSEAGIGEDFLFLFDFINKQEKVYVIPEGLFMWRKFQDLRAKGQKNQSLGDFDNVRARKNILYYLQKRKDLNPFISEFIISYEFREKFLYSPILVEKDVNGEKLLGLGLEKKHRDEYVKFLNKSNFFSARYGPYIKRCLIFVNLFGFKGLINIFKVSYQRVIYRLTIFLSLHG